MVGSNVTESARLPVLLMARELGLGGTERQLAETALALDRAIFEPHVACFRAGGFRAGELVRAGVAVLPLGVESLVSGSAAAGARRLGRYLNRHRIQVVHLFDVPSVHFGVLAARMYRAPVVLSSARAHRTLLVGWKHHLLRLTDRMVDGIVVNSRAVARELTDEEDVPESLIHLAYNGIDTDRFRADGFRTALPWTGPGLTVGVACALRPEKGLDILLDAVARLRKSCAAARLLIVGSGPMEPALRERSRELELGAACHFQPAVEEVAPWLRAIDIFVLPSLSEALSNSLMEAMACGCCAVASDVGGNPELVKNEETGLLFRSGDREGLGRCLERLASDEKLRRTLACTGAEFIRSGFSRAAVGARMGRIYLECASRARV
jgi:L-malate glycosyltransferase